MVSSQHGCLHKGSRMNGQFYAGTLSISDLSQDSEIHGLFIGKIVLHYRAYKIIHVHMKKKVLI